MYPDPPEEIIEKILLIVPIKSLIRFKSVHKSWLALISDRNFLAKNFHQRSKFKNKDAHILVEYRSREHNHDFRYSFLSYDTLEVSEAGLLPYPDLPWEQPVIEHIIDIRIVGVCNGVVCLNDNLDLFTVLWSPTSKDVNVLPLCPCENLTNTVHAIGFCFDMTSNAFKVIKMVPCYGSHDELEKHYNVLIYTSKTNSWKQIYPTIPFYEISYNSLSSNGFISWLGCAFKPNGSRYYEIISFDINNEVFKTPEIQSNEAYDVLLYLPHGVFSNLVTLYGHVALVINNCSSNSNHMRIPLPPFSYDVWVLLELGVRESWTKLFTIRTPEKLEYPLGFWTNGEIFEMNGDLASVSHNENGQELKTLQIDAVWFTTSICP